MTVFEHAGKLLIVDCGVLFPEEHQPGIDVILPDFTSIRDRIDDVVAHRAHPRPRGPHRRRALPAAGAPRHPAGRLEAHAGVHRRQAQGAPDQAGHPARWPRATGSRSGRSTCEFLAVNHSIPDALAVAIRTARRAGAAHRRLQDGPVPARRPDHRPARLRPARRGGRGPVPHRLDQRRGARLHHLRGRARAGDRDGVPHRPRRVIVSSFASHVHRIQQVLDAAHAHGRKVAFVGRSMVRNMGIARDLGYLNVPAGPGRRHEGAREAARRPGLPGLHRLAGRADGGAVAHGQPRPRHPHHRGRHRAAGQLADPRQRERDLPGHQRADPVGRQRRAQGQRQGARLRPRQRRRARLLLQPRPARATSCRCTASGGTCRPTPSWRSAPACTRRASSSPRTAWSSTWSTAGCRSPARCPPATSTSTAQTVGGVTEASLKDRRTLAEEGVITVVAIVDADTGRLVEPPDFLARGFVHDEHDLRRRRPADREGAREGRRGGRRDGASSSSS